MKKKGLMIVLAMALTLTTAGAVWAQVPSNTTKAPGTWVSSINVQNTGGGAATVAFDFHDTAGASALNWTDPSTIPAGGSRSYYVPAQIPGLANGQYSVIISSDQPLQVVANQTSSGAAIGAGSYQGVQGTDVAKELNFPGLYKNYYGYYSEIVLQNTESTDAVNVRIKFYSQNTGAEVANLGPYTIPATSSRVFATQDMTAVPSGNVNGLLSAVVTSDKNLAGVANHWLPGSNQFSNYNAVVAGSTTYVYAPALYKNYYGFVSALTVQNIDSTAGTIEVTYSNGTVRNALLQPHQSIEYYQPADAALPSGDVNGVFSAKIRSVDGKKIVAFVNGRHTTKGSLCSYNCPIQATNSVNCPVVLKSFYNFFSAQTVQNVGTANTNITITYAGGQTKTWYNVPPNGTVNIVEIGTNTPLPGNSSVSAVITSSGQPIVAVVQENDTGPQYTAHPGDYLTAYTGIPQ